ncbi:non-ribosomal peptide synthetase [Gynurincola endophyticus]|uniref:non-ribosomal peptide synthetase n=1 Tax=Gynurincola endophyticus TaxID=2479004 RepID=UPI000F8D763E|nr:non-ribosomal peptide synthetase [Gynurincola endophyticus]
MLSIWKSGAAFVSFDSSYPTARLEFMAEDVNADFLITTASLRHKASFFKGNLIVIDDPETMNAILQIDDNTHQSDQLPNELAYLAYTSGSTGIPKAVMATHEGLANFIENFKKVIDPGINDSVLQISSPNFDGLGLDLWAPLSYGLKVHLYPDNRIVGEPLLDFIIDRKISILPYIPVSILSTLPRDGRTGNIKKLCFGGEAPLHVVIDYWKTKVKVTNIYGPTETTVITSAFHYNEHYPLATIGRAFTNVGYHLLDENLQPVPKGEAGELYITGVQLSKGYWKRPDLTAERFVNITLANGSVQRAYKTGDLFRELEDGNIVFAGRADLQIKIRGFRVEVSEIEEVLRKSGLVHNCAVIAKGEEEKKLICYYIAEKEVASDTFRKHLYELLPAYMIPSSFVHIDVFPLTDNGKIDRSVLREMETSTLYENRASYVEPVTDIQKELSAIWSSMLGTSPIGLKDNFFYFGGNSILAYKTVSIIRKRFGNHVQVADIFLYPTLEELADYLTDSATNTPVPEIISTTEKMPVLSYQQQSLWFLDQLSNSSDYHILVRYEVKPDISFKKLEKAFRLLINEHQILRTVIKNENGIAYQTLLEADHFELNRLDGNIPIEDIQLPFDLSNDFMLSAYLQYADATPSHLFIVIHHIATDGWSMPVLIKSLNTYYHSLSHVIEHPSVEEKLQYRDYAHWQQQKTFSGDSILFWENYLKGVTLLDLPYSTAHLKNIKKGKQYRFFIHERLSDDLKNLAENEQVTLYMVMLSAFSLLMQHYTQQDDICIGSPVANRTHPALDEMIGYFVNTLPVRIKIENDPLYKDFLKNISTILPKVFRHQEIPLEMIIHHAGNYRNEGNNPFFNTVFALQDSFKVVPQLTDVVFYQPEWLFNGSAKFDLQFEVLPQGKELLVNIEYKSPLFSDNFIQSLATGYMNLLKSIAENPDTNISSFEITPVPAELQLPAPAPDNKKIIELFETQVMNNPDKIAVHLSGDEISYAGLNQQSGHIAEILSDLATVPGDFIACMLDQRIDRISVLLGIVKSGAAYVPLDVQYPLERIRTVLEDIKPKYLITSTRFKEKIKDLEVDCLFVEELMINYQQTKVKDSYADNYNDKDLMYVIHTSGTTGHPKGVLIEHRAANNYIREIAELLEINSKDKTIQFSPYNFDGSIIDLWMPLTQGATLYLYPNNKLLGDPLAEFLIEKGITKIPFISPSVLSTLPKISVFSKISVIGTGAESCPPALSNYWSQKVKLLNLYGPTETTVSVNRFVFDLLHSSNTIGVPTSNMRFYVLDKFERVVPAGVKGELHLSGIQLARGYHQQPELTNEKFITNHFIKSREGDNIFDRLYKTGDLVKYSEEGLLEYLGRKDQQVKIRGQRVELQEIEHHLMQIEGVNNAVVQLVNHTQPLSIRAFFTGNITVNDLRQRLSQKLPAYMIPSTFIPLKIVPVNHNGKLDQHELNRLADHYQHTFVHEETPVGIHEIQLKKIWEEVLNRKIMQLDDNFFNIGGHSLLLIKLYNRISEYYPGKLSLGDLYTNSSIRDLASFLENKVLQAGKDPELGKDALSRQIMEDANIDLGDLAISSLPKGNFLQPEKILLTGVTGFVGAHLLTELLHHTAADIYVLIRSQNTSHASSRLYKTLDEQKIILPDIHKNRIKVLSGDLSIPDLGLSAEDYAFLASELDIIYHAGSAVNFIQPYAYMKATNIDGFRMLIKLATDKKLKKIALLSTVGVFSWEHHFSKPAILRETDPIDSVFRCLSRDMGYVQSKWVMEKMAFRAIEQGLPITIFRLGYVFTNGNSGATAKYQWWSLFVKTCTELKYYPLLGDQKEEFVTVDFVARSIVHIAPQPQATGKVFHLSPDPANNITVVDFFEMLNQEFNMGLQPVSYGEWVKMWEKDENSPLYPLLSLFKFEVYDKKSLIELHQDTPNFDITNTLEHLEGSGIKPPKVNRNILLQFCRYMNIID